MSGNVIDVSGSVLDVPDPIVIDSNIAIALFEQYFPGQAHQHVAQVRTFFQDRLGKNQQAVLTPTAFSEVLHLAVRKTYERRLAGNRAELARQFGTRIDGWHDLYKQDPTPLRRLAPSLTLLSQGLVSYNIVIAESEDLDPSAAVGNRRLGDILIERMTRYGLDSSDAMITIEASRLGIGAIVSMDRDIRRAAADFDIYTWL